ncbi:MAG: Zn-dependent hydrolase [Cyclobacteriaceae bacterium]|nr:Zn-dependent hydrolase [Cyclobacteriaceae bacterium]
MKVRIAFIYSMLILGLFYCKPVSQSDSLEKPDTTLLTPSDKLLQKYVTVKLTTDLSTLSESEKKMIPLLIDAGKIMDGLFWYEAYGDKETLLSGIHDEKLREFALINYGPWDRLDGNTPFLENVGPKPAGANYYPHDMTREEFEKAALEGKDNFYTFIRRDGQGNLITVPYHEQFEPEITKAASLLREAAELSENEAFKNYLLMRAEALLTDDYQPSDMAWMDMKDNHLELVIGPIESYEDQLFGYKTSHEAYVLVKDLEWSEKLTKYAAYLPALQEGLPVPEAYKKERPGSNADLNAYDVVFYAGDCNAGSKTIAINLPNDEEVQLAKGTRRLQLKNAMQAKFDKILIPIAESMVDESQRHHITFNAFFSNTMFHEVAHGLGIKNTINGSGTVREAIKEHYSALEEGKADVLGLYMISQLHEKGEIKGDLMDYYVTFMTSVFRSVRFGASSAHGKANMVRFNFFIEHGAFVKNKETGLYTVVPDKMEKAMNALSEKILVLQGDGNYQGVASLVQQYGGITPDLQNDLDKLGDKGIPVDIIFEQGVDVLGL